MHGRRRDFSAYTEQLDTYLASLRKNVSKDGVPSLAIGTFRNAVTRLTYMERAGCDSSVSQQYKNALNNNIFDRNPVPFQQAGLKRYPIQ